MRVHPIHVATVATLVFLACGGERPQTQETPAVESSATQAKAIHADATVVPGSYEDWCGEHEVPESMCTRCDPTLVAAFKATGDWCAEHGLPESQCLRCDPNLKITRPPQPEEK